MLLFLYPLVFTIVCTRRHYTFVVDQWPVIVSVLSEAHTKRPANYNQWFTRVPTYSVLRLYEVAHLHPV